MELQPLNWTKVEAWCVLARGDPRWCGADSVEVAPKAAAGDVWKSSMLRFGKEELLVFEEEQIEGKLDVSASVLGCSEV